MLVSRHHNRIIRIAGLSVAATAVAVALGTAQPASAATDAGTRPASIARPAAAEGRTAPGQPRFGDKGAAVEAVQKALIGNGFTLRGGVSGVFDARTRQTLRNFQRVVGLKVSGVVDMRTAQVLRLGAPTSTTSMPVASTATFPFTLETLPRRGASGDSVRLVQKTLASTGLVVRGGIDGFFGRGTTATITEYQTIKGLAVTGLLDADTAASLGLIAPVATATTAAPTTVVPVTTAAPATTVPAAPAPAVSAAGTPALTIDTLPKRGDKGDTVVAVQKALIAAGTEVKGGVDGVFGIGTASAIKRYQSTNGLVVSGRLDVRTAHKLNLIAAPPVEIAVFPMQGPCSYTDTWHAPRGNRLHLGVDIIGAEGLLIYAVADGTITKTYSAGKDALTGNGLRLTTADGTYFFYGHLQRLADGIAVGTQVKAGQVLGTNGKTGNTNTPHLHFEVHPRGGEAINPTAIVAAVDACQVTAPRPTP